jgi:Na+-transporting NADH:ubiquinone oxidoreductase subunit NqrF
MKNTGNKRKATFYFGANVVNELFLIDLMRDFESELGDFTFVPVVALPAKDESWDGRQGLVTEAVQRNLKNASQCEAYLCGSAGLIDAAIEVLTELGVRQEAIFYDKFE